MRGIVRDTMTEALDRKIIWVFGIIAVFATLFALAPVAIDAQFGGQEFDVTEMGEETSGLRIRGYDTLMWFLIFLSVMATAGTIPNMLIRGRADFYLSKPISRTSLLVSKVLGIWLVYGGLMTAVVGIVFIVSSIVFGVFDSSIWFVIVGNMLLFLIWLSITSVAGILSGTAGMSMMAAFGCWAAQWLLGFHDQVKMVVDSKAVTGFVDGLYYIFPKTGEISDLIVAYADGRVNSWMPLWSSLIFAAVMFAIAIVSFRRRDY